MSDDADRIAKLEARIAELEAKQPKPEPVYDPKPTERRDPTSNFQMPRQALEDMLRVVDDKTMRAISKDRKAELPLVGGQSPTGNGWVNPQKLKSGLQQ